jgi:hypothetical protein
MVVVHLKLLVLGLLEKGSLPGLLLKSMIIDSLMTFNLEDQPY